VASLHEPSQRHRRRAHVMSLGRLLHSLIAHHFAVVQRRVCAKRDVEGSTSSARDVIPAQGGLLRVAVPNAEAALVDRRGHGDDAFRRQQVINRRRVEVRNANRPRPAISKSSLQGFVRRSRVLDSPWTEWSRVKSEYSMPISARVELMSESAVAVRFDSLRG